MFDIGFLQKTLLAVLDSLMEEEDGIYDMTVEPLEASTESEVKRCLRRKNDTIFQILARKERKVGLNFTPFRKTLIPFYYF